MMRPWLDLWICPYLSSIEIGKHCRGIASEFFVHCVKHKAFGSLETMSKD